MATPDLTQVIKGISGRLVKDPTDLSTAFPHGGTALGVSGKIAFRPQNTYKEINAEEFGNKPVNFVFTGSRPVMVAIIQDMDDDILQQVFMDTATGATTGKTVVSDDSSTGTTRAGELMDSRAFKLLFTPDDDDHPAIIMYNAVPQLEAAAEVQLALNLPLETALVFEGIPDGSGRKYDMGRIQDIAL